MAKIFKVSGYIVDVNGGSNVDEVIAEVSSGFDGMINQHIHVEFTGYLGFANFAVEVKH